MDIDRVIHGINKYINSEIYPAMNDWQEVMARVVVGRMLTNAEDIRHSLMSNPFLRSFGIMDAEGEIDLDGLSHELKKQIEEKGSITITFPLMPKFKFTASDIDRLYDCIMRT